MDFSRVRAGAHRLSVSGVVVAVVVVSACSGAEPPAGSASTPAGTPVGTPSATVSATPHPSPSPSRTPSPAPVTTDYLTGGKRSTNVVFAVKIENTAAARPQVGLHQADIVVVEEVEASITRMIGIFHTRFPKRVGPVRSARNTDAELLPMFGRPGLLYSGANSKVKRNLRESSVALRERSDRDTSRVAPHNVMVDLPKMVRHTDAGRAQSIGWTFAASDRRWSGAKKVADPSVRVGGDTTGFDWSGGRYAVTWNGRADVDGDSDDRVRTDNVVVLSVQNHHDDDSTSDISIVSETVGSGKVRVYRDGKSLTGTWSRGSVAGPMRFRDRSGQDIPLKPGQTWLLLQG